MTEQPAEEPSHDCELGPKAIRGARTIDNVPFINETVTPVNVLTGETPTRSQATVDDVREFSSSNDTNTPQIALPALVERRVETASKPCTAAAFFHFKANGSLECHRAYHAAYESDVFSSTSKSITSLVT